MVRAGRRDLIEYWGHEASLLPVELQPLLRWRMARADALAWKSVARVAAEQPELLGDRLVARVDLKSDRQTGVLRVRGAFAEPHADTALVAEELADELRPLSDWLELGGVSLERKGDLAAPLRRAVV